MGGPVHHVDEALPSAEDHGFKKIDEEDYDPEACLLYTSDAADD